ncbi:MAG: hypothetical protein AB1555_06295 [Nitrospirota bacterium]
MSRRPHYLELPWSMHRDHTREPFSPTRRLWWLIAALAFLAIFLIGVTSSLIEDAVYGDQDRHHVP